MSEKREDGGPAFPSHASLGNLSVGMTLRDYFAARALQNISHNLYPEDHINKDWNMELLARTAEQCYRWADAMIAERNK